MSEKVRTYNLTSGGNILVTATTTSSTPSVAASGDCPLIGAPTLISSTFCSSNTQVLTPTGHAANLVEAGSKTGGNSGGMVGCFASSDGHASSSSCDVGGGEGGGGGGGGSDTESSNEYASGPIIAQLNFHLLPSDTGVGSGVGLSGTTVESSCVVVGGGIGGECNSIMNSSQISTLSNDSMQLTHDGISTTNGNKSTGAAGKHLTAQNVAGKNCRFPKLEECAHFHYERVQLGPLLVRLVDDKSECLNSSIASQSISGDIAGNQFGYVGSGNAANVAATSTMAISQYSSQRTFSPLSCSFIIKVCPFHSDSFLIRRTFENMQMLDEMLHRCVYDRKISALKDLNQLEFKNEEEVEYAVAKYLERFSKIASDSVTCGTVLTWFQLDNKGRRLPLADIDTMRTINTPAVGAAYGVRRYQAQAADEISIEVGDMISVIDMPSPAESIWWRGKKSHLQKSQYEVGFFPQSCVATIGEKVPRYIPMPPPLVGQLDVSPTKPVLRKHGKLIAFFRSFILSRPSRRRLKQSGIYRERVFSCDLSEHLLNSGQDIPMVLKCCSEFIEKYGIVDGIYRLSGITSNIQRLRRAFDEERIPDLGNPEMKQDIHAVSSLLKMYFRELPNPLCTYQLYDNFVEAIQAKTEAEDRLRMVKETVLKLPPPHYRTLKYLAEHLNKISQHATRTGMTDKNLAIVWAPNLLRSPALESGGVAALRGVGVQAVVTEYLIRNCNNIFDALDDPNARLSYIATLGASPASDLRIESLTDCESLLVEQREHDQFSAVVERPKSLSTGGAKLISLEEAQERHLRTDGCDLKQSMPITMISSNASNIGSYIEVGGGPSSLPDKYHTVLSAPRSWQKRKTHSWKSLFTRNQRVSNNGGESTSHDLKSGAGSSEMDNSPPRTKVASQVKFADTDAVVSNYGKSTKPLLKLSKPKSIELFETATHCETANKPIEVCPRSNSIDSLRTAGHSRSVSHDSYFDMLQSPQRIHVNSCPSRELSELGLNFDREEPEMRIFSESESLVSSPRIGKENLPPSSGAASRRILRARPEEFSSQTNSVNPSPKKQPRLNLLLSPNSAAAISAQNWNSQGNNLSDGAGNSTSGNSGACHEHAHLLNDESCCKRYKFEDQLSDIQYIDCSTPEHTIANAQALYGSVTQQMQGALPKLAHNKQHYGEGAGKMPESALEKKKKSFEKMLKCAEVPASPTPSASSSSSSVAGMRYSYPTVQLGGKRKDQEQNMRNGGNRERFSYPVSKQLTTKVQVEDVDVEEICNHYNREPNEATNNTKQSRNISFGIGPQQQQQKKPLQQHPPIRTLPEFLRPKSRSSYCDNNDQLSLLLARSAVNDAAKCEMERSKISVTPSSPTQSPRYSLLVGETSSENSSAVNTPQHDLDPLMITSAMSGLSGLSGLSGASSNQQQHLLQSMYASSSCLDMSHESVNSNLTSSTHNNQMKNSNSSEKRDMHALKRELSLDLNPLSQRMTMEPSNNNNNNTSNNKQNQLLVSPSNNSNFTDNTSQSVTPSEFGYQHLQRQSSMHSLIETEENSPAYEEYEHMQRSLASPLLGSKKFDSPIKSTISITYNLKSGGGNDGNAKIYENLKEQIQKQPKTLLETSFDENTVYEQVEFFRNSVTEVNQMLNENCKTVDNLLGITEANEYDDENEVVVDDHDHEEQDNEVNEKEMRDLSVQKTEEFDKNKKQFIDTNLEMKEENLIDCEQEENLLYQNVELRKPKSIYENMLGETMKAGKNEFKSLDYKNLPPKPYTEHNNKIKSIKHHQQQQQQQQQQHLPQQHSQSHLQQATESDLLPIKKSPSSIFSVKELATKFETSPAPEQLQLFEVGLRSSIKRPGVGSTLSTVPQEAKASQQSLISSTDLQKVLPTPTILKQKLTKSQQITRSLDENAFVREFGTKNFQELTARSTQVLPEWSSDGISSRRKSFDFTRPKTLNPPKRLPGMPITEEICQRSEKPLMKPSDFLHKEKLYNQHPQQLGLGTRLSGVCNERQEMKLTPTLTPIIPVDKCIPLKPQTPTTPTTATEATLDLNNSNSNTTASSNNSNNIKGVLSGVKLDRERIDKIKEERRQQLTQKYRAESFKSRSKLELNSCGKEEDNKMQAESLRIKSKSRGDMRTLQKDIDIDNMKSFGRGASAYTGSESTLHSSIQPQQQPQIFSHRVRSISDEKNQNCEVSLQNTVQSININSANSNVLADASNIKTKTNTANQARATVDKFERKSLEVSKGNNEATTVGGGGGGHDIDSNIFAAGRNRISATREKISPQFSIRDVTAMFESRSQSQQ